MYAKPVIEVVNFADAEIVVNLTASGTVDHLIDTDDEP